MPETVSAVLGPDYERIAPMAAGGTGELFRAHKRGLDVDVVVKRCKTKYRGRMDETREARILKNLRHQYLPRIYDVIYAADGSAYTVMDYIEGCNLEQYVQQHGALSQKQVVRWLRQIAEVIAYLHKQRPAVIHCDLKPQNVMITPEGDICVIDFNTSLLYSNTAQQALGATAGYAAPEQYHLSAQALAGIPEGEREKWTNWSRIASRFGKVTEQTDIYAMGALAYFMMTGYTPGHCLEGHIPLTRYRIQLGDSLRAVIEKAMQVDPRERFSSARAMLYALENLKKTDRRYRSWQIRCQVTAVMLSVLVIASIFSVWMGVQLRGRETTDQYLALVEEAEGLIDRQAYDEGLALLTQAVALKENRIEAYVQMATVFYRLGRYDECVDMLSGLTFVDDDLALTQKEFEYAQAELNYLLGSCHYQLKDYANAVRCMDMAVWFAPEESRYYRDLAVSQAKMGDMNAAERTYRAMKDLDDENREDLLLVESELKYAQGDYEDALEALLQLTRSEDASLVSRSYLLAAWCYRYMGDSYLSDEIALLTEACTVLDIASADAAREQLADACLRCGAKTGDTSWYEKAVSVLDEILLRPMAPLSVYLNKALALQYLAEYEEAIDVAGEAVEHYPNDYRGYMRLALLHLNAPVYDADAAIAYYEQARVLYEGANAQSSEFMYLESMIAKIVS